MAPETLQNIFTTRADVFSLGMTILSTICDIELPKNGDLWLKVISTQLIKMAVTKYFSCEPMWACQPWQQKIYKNYHPICKFLFVR